MTEKYDVGVTTGVGRVEKVGGGKTDSKIVSYFERG